MGGRNLEYRHLEAFRAVMRAGSATGAAALLGISQPAISRLLAQTESLAGLNLFERVKGRLLPTPIAHALFEEADRMFIGMQEIATLCERLQRQQPRQMVIAALPVMTLSVLPAAALAWRRSGRQETLSIHSRNAGNVLGLVSSRQADLGINLNMARVPGVRSALLARCRYVCVMAPDHPLARRPGVRVRDLHGEAFVALSRDEGTQTIIDAAFDRANVRPREVAECRLLSAAVLMAAAGVGVTLADAFAIAPFLDHGLTIRSFDPVLHSEYRLLWPEDDRKTTERHHLAQHVRAASREILRQVKHRLAVAGDEKPITRQRSA